MRVLFLTHRLPYAPNRGDRVRSFHIVRSLAARVELTVCSLVQDRHESAHAEDLRKLGVTVRCFEVPHWRNYLRAAIHLTGLRPLTHVLLDAPGITTALRDLAVTREPDVILAFCSGMARFAMEPPLDRLPLVIDLVDVDSAKWSALSEVVGTPRNWIYRREARLLSQFEQDAAMHASCTCVVNDREAELLRTIAPSAEIRVVPVGVDLDALAPTNRPIDAGAIVFCGVMSYQPNIDAVAWFTKNVWPRIRRERSDATFTIVGSDPSPEIRALADQRSGVTVTDTVLDVREYLWNAALSVAPIRIARGVQTKVLEAVAAGLPAVVTSAVFDGLPTAARPACRVADSPEAFATATLGLLGLSGEERRSLARRADLAALRWESQLAPLLSILEAAAGGQEHARTADRAERR